MWDVPNSLKNCLVAVGIPVRYMKHKASMSQFLISTAYAPQTGWNCHVRSWKQEEFSGSSLLFRRKAKGGTLSNMAFFSWRHQRYLKRIDPSRPRV